MAEYIERESLLKEIENDYKNVEKIKTHFARIVVDGSAENPYYSILWFDAANKEYNIGYSSYCLDYVFKWLEVVFEIVPLDEATAADVEPVRHGRWIDNGSNGYKWAFICSKCGYVDGYPFDDRYNFCPDCGADMRGDKSANK